MKILKIFTFLLILVTGYVFYIFYSTGYFRKIEPFTGTGEIRSYSLPGVEDLAIDPLENFIILSSDDRAARRDGKSKQGGLYYLNLNDDADPVLMTQDFDSDFYPHGISMVQLSDSVYRIWAINHPEKDSHQIEIFDLVGSKLTHKETLNHPLLISPNDLIAIDSSRFYFTNDHGFQSKWGLLAENYLGLAVSTVIYYDGITYKEAAAGIAYANGITFDNKRSLIYVASPRSFAIKVYKRADDGTLSYLEDIDVDTGVDNLMLDKAGNIWSGAHPDLLKFTSYAAGKTEIAPSEVITIQYKGQNDWTISGVFLDDGGVISGSSVAVPTKKHIFIGNVMDNKMIRLAKK